MNKRLEPVRNQIIATTQTFQHVLSVLELLVNLRDGGHPNNPYVSTRNK